MAKSRFWGNFWGETGRNSGKWVSNKVFGNSGWATPKRHIFNTDSKRTEKVAKKAFDDLSESFSIPKTSSSKTVIEKNVATNEHDVKIFELKKAKLLEVSKREEKESKMTMWIVIVTIVVVTLLFLLMFHYQEKSRLADVELQLKLEKTELQINLLLKEGKKAEASELIFELNHPSDKAMPSNESLENWLDHKETYNEHWMAKRAYYMELVKQ